MKAFVARMLAHTPLMWVAVPLAAGLFIGHSSTALTALAFILIASIALAVTLTLWARQPEQRRRARLWWRVAFVLLAAGVGTARALIDRNKPIPTQYLDQTALAEIETVDFYDFSMRMQAKLVRLGNYSPQHCRILITTQSLNYDLNTGDRIVFKADLRPFEGLHNPDELDPAQYQWQRGISYLQHTHARDLHIIGHHATILSRCAGFNRWLRQAIRTGSLPERFQTIVIALLLGNDTHIDTQLRTNFAHAGVAHILALSGLHVGIVVALFYILLFPLDYLRLKKLRLLISIGMMIAYAMLTGLSPSVMRATVMTAAVLLAFLFNRRNSALNALMLAATVLLMISPRAVYNAGFQLSFITVAAIVAFRDILPQPSREHRLRYYLSASLAVSALALTVTLGITAYYFNTISWASIVTNLLVLPALPVLMVAGVALIFLSALGIDWEMLNTVISALCSYIEGIARWVASCPLTHLSGIYFDGIDTLIYYTAAALLLAWLVSRNKSYLVGSLAAASLLIGHIAYTRTTLPARGIFVLNDYHATPILSFCNHTAWLWIPDRSQPDLEAFRLRHRRLLAHYSLNTINLVDQPSADSMNVFNPPFAFTAGRRIAVFGRNGAVYPTLPQHIDIAVIARGFTDSIATIRRHWDVGHIIVGGAVSDLRQERIAREADSAAWFLATQGAYTEFAH